MAQTILVVEDDRDFGRQLVDLFTFLGYAVRFADTGTAAVEEFERGGIDLMLVDLMLPLMSGVEVVRCIRGLADGGDVPVMMMSAVYRNPRMFERELRSLDVLEFLSKPFSLIDLGRRVDAALHQAEKEEGDEASITETGSWRVEDLDFALGDDLESFEPKGSFDRRSLLAILIAIFRGHLAGRLRLIQGRSTRDLYFLNGYPVWGTSDDPTERLGAVLKRSKALETSQLATIDERVERSGQPFREAVLESGHVTERQLLMAERARVARVVVGSFSSAGGTYEFSRGDEWVDRVGVFEVNPVGCLGEAVSRFLSVNDLAPDIYRYADQIARRGHRYSRFVAYLNLPPELATLPAALGEGVSISELFKRFGTAQEALIKYLWLMLRLGIAETTANVPATSLDVLPSEDELDDADSFGGPGFDASALSQSFLPVVDSFADEAAPEIDITLDEASRLVVRDYLLKMEGDLYGVLGVGRKASLGELGAAYARLRDRYALGRLSNSTPTAVRNKAKELLDLVETAFVTLTDPARRTAYDRGLDER